ncbi:MAG: AAA family ATPase [Myxococcales bacterium]|nr:AAA family ATPase [Myxococcales bacterium]
MVIHQAKWVGAGTPPPDGQCSFLVADPDKGLLLLAVHPGGLAYDPHGDRWRSGTSAIPDPTTLLDTYAHGLGTLLGRQPSAPLTRPMVGWALVLPDAFVGSRGLAPQAPASRIIDRQGLDDIAARLDQLFSHWHERQPARGNASPRWWWRAMEELFVAPREVRVRLRDQIDADRADMLALSTQQTAVLEMLSRVRRLTVYGPAGTGKTVLALAKARSLAQRGQRVLLTCYNKALGHYLREETAQEPAITAMHFHELCCDFAGLTQEQRQPPTGAGAVNRFYDETLPNLLKHHAQLDGPQYDAVVVDEAQDFLPRWWDALDALCHDGDRAIRYLFYDDGQCLRTHKPPVPGAAEALVLRTNWRNTKTIHGWLGKTEPRVRATPCASPSGVPVQVERMAAGLEQVLRRVLRRLIDGGGLAPEDIVILTGRNPDRSAVAALAQPVGPAVISKDGGPGVVRLSSVYAFKGLEARVVILTELNQAKRSRALFYVGASRAMNHLIVLEDALPGPESQS